MMWTYVTIYAEWIVGMQFIPENSTTIPIDTKVTHKAPIHGNTPLRIASPPQAIAEDCLKDFRCHKHAEYSARSRLYSLNDWNFGGVIQLLFQFIM